MERRGRVDHFRWKKGLERRGETRRCTRNWPVTRADEMDSSRAIWRPVTKGLRKQRIVLSPANCCIIHAFLARSGRKPCPAPGLLSPLPLFPSRGPPFLSFSLFLSVRLRKIHFVPVGRLRRAINAAVYGEGYLDYELERLEDLRSSKLVPSLSQRIVSKIWLRARIHAFYRVWLVSEKETNSSWREPRVMNFFGRIVC